MTTTTTSLKSCFAQKLEQALQQHGIPLSKQQQQVLATHFSLLQQWNKVHNLTRICTVQEAVMQHYIDSLLPLQKLQPQQELLDVGSGAGFPGLVAAVLWPEVSVRLLDSCRKKCSFLQTAIAHMKLQNVRVQHGKAPHCSLAPCVLSRATFCVEHVRIAAQCLRPNNVNFLALWVTQQQVEPIRKPLQGLDLHIENVVTYSLLQKQKRAVVIARQIF